MEYQSPDDKGISQGFWTLFIFGGIMTGFGKGKVRRLGIDQKLFRFFGVFGLGRLGVEPEVQRSAAVLRHAGGFGSA